MTSRRPAAAASSSGSTPSATADRSQETGGGGQEHGRQEHSAEPDPPSVEPAASRGSRIPARWRIAGWIVLTTGFTLLVLILVMRSLLINDVETAANVAIEQEADEFRTFAREGVDPRTGEPFESVAELLELYLSRQHPDQGEVLIGVGGDEILVSDNSRLTTESGEEYHLASDTATLDRILDSPDSGGVLTGEQGQLRWGKITINTQGEPGVFVVAEFVENSMEANDRIIRMTVLVALGGLLLTAGISYLVAGRILAPVRSIGRAAAEISESDLSVRVPVRTRDDLGELAQSFNNMLDRIEDAHTAQRRFVDDASHELRTPITVIRGHLELLGEDPGERAATLAVVDRELGRMSRIVTDLLMLAKAERPDFVVREETDLAKMMLDVESTLQALDDRPWLLMEVAEGRAAVDAQRLTQVMVQYATNAVQYSPPGTPVRFGSTVVPDDDAGAGGPVGGLLRLWMSDAGRGIDEKDMPRVFDRFNRAGAGSAHEPGVGLGLSIVRAIADAHGGRAWVESAVGEGSTFGIDVPVPLDRTAVATSDEHAAVSPQRAALRVRRHGREPR
ncbi:HAMP domain-containing sensor histidine kinase [Georgenia halophila]|uniref:Sensor-like histidine kinase SenX3 n=2 Tax=Georgenia halophila TaxID=620889 RepID=A0ABP8LKA8_9MICO